MKKLKRLVLGLVVVATLVPITTNADAPSKPAPTPVSIVQQVHQAQVSQVSATTGSWWCLDSNGNPTVQTPYTDPGPNGHRQAVIWCRLNTGQADAGFLE